MTPVAPGTQLDHYRIDREVARSGMATIFRGVDLRNGRDVAIKVPHPEMEGDPVFFDRFRREAEIGAALDHPGVMKVYQDPDRSRVYMVMEWVEGRLLREILKSEGKLPPERAVRIAIAHLRCARVHPHARRGAPRPEAGKHHGLDAEDHIKLIDFGIAGEGGRAPPHLRQLRNAMGTPEYISPEQVKGKRGDARSDIYALGVMLYEMLTGKVPFRGPNPCHHERPAAEQPHPAARN